MLQAIKCLKTFDLLKNASLYLLNSFVNSFDLMNKHEKNCFISCFDLLKFDLLTPVL